MSSAAAKSLARHVLPQGILEIGKKSFARRQIQLAAKALATAPEQPAWLDASRIPDLAKRYPVAYDFVRTTPAPDRRAAARTLKHCGASSVRLLEIGGGPALVSWGLALAGKQAVCLDILDEVDPGARAAGVQAVVGSACAMDLPDNSFDAAFSYNAFEHIDDPEKALQETWRVVRPGGRIHLAFAPIYNAPLGLHAFHEFGIPYIQHLWDEDILRPLVTSRDLWHLNHWPLARYRKLWSDVADRFETLLYREERDYQGLELVQEFPSCFAKRSRDIDEFTVSKIVVTFKVRK